MRTDSNARAFKTIGEGQGQRQGKEMTSASCGESAMALLRQVTGPPNEGL